MNRIWPYPGLHNRVFLDFPLDLLLNRECSLKSHEAGLVTLLQAYEKAVKVLTPEEITVVSNILKETKKDAISFWPQVKDWQAVIQGKWKIAFSAKKDLEAFNGYTNRLLTEAPNPRKAIKKILQFHLLLHNRTIGALRLPNQSGLSLQAEGTAGSGNIVIEGPAGSGKSTLALQIALEFAGWPNNYHAVYVALEEPIGDLCAKAKDLCEKWCEKLKPVVFLDDVEGESSPRAIGKCLENLLNQPLKCPMILGRRLGAKCKCPSPDHGPKVLLPGLSPRAIVPQETDNNGLFWERLQQIERLLAGAEWLRNKKPDIPKIGLVCIDSLNTFGSQILTREELCRLFGLFRQYGVLGLCTVEAGIETEQMASSDLVDILIRLHARRDGGYFTRYFEIAKSRYQHQIYGQHPFKIRREQEVRNETRPQ